MDSILPYIISQLHFPLECRIKCFVQYSHLLNSYGTRTTARRSGQAVPQLPRCDLGLTRYRVKRL